MGRVAVIGEGIRAAGFGLAGAVVFAAESAADVVGAWQRLPGDIVVVILTPTAAQALDTRRFADGRPCSVVMPA